MLISEKCLRLQSAPIQPSQRASATHLADYMFLGDLPRQDARDVLVACIGVYRCGTEATHPDYLGEVAVTNVRVFLEPIVNNPEGEEESQEPSTGRKDNRSMAVALGSEDGRIVRTDLNQKQMANAYII